MNILKFISKEENEWKEVLTTALREKNVNFIDSECCREVCDMLQLEYNLVLALYLGLEERDNA